ncbi:hypothetical protein K2173_012763 [Erythroxylum novogranatense]|uniref:DC1 domain-containing protein n=1 Tax=Erythroxylum novogranatense TaxID=1862640 RepID=A0AAV8TLF0_9ROSI|nr:hypothetical protein K2173_012763 [Erythroxylum novogranatense]
MCAQTIPSIGNHFPNLNDNGSKVGFSHFSHDHKLRFAFIPKKLEVDCSACWLLISGPTYCCYTCYFFLHESCFDELKPQYIQHPFHIQHPLHFKARVGICNACTTFSDIGYECAEGDFKLDIKCAKYLTSGLQHKCHEHKLFCFVVEDINGHVECCKHCYQMCNASFYRCLECDLNIHIECIPIPKNVKSVCHVHPLTLILDSITKKGQDEYYCHACENLRNPKHAAYYCKKCYYTAHIGCVLGEVRFVLQSFLDFALSIDH